MNRKIPSRGSNSTLGHTSVAPTTCEPETFPQGFAAVLYEGLSRSRAIRMMACGLGSAQAMAFVTYVFVVGPCAPISAPGNDGSLAK